MRAYPEQLFIPEDEVFLIKENKLPTFTTPRHYHRELEIKLMVSGFGKAYIGDTIYEYEPGELVMLGPNLPHHWLSSNHYEEKGILADCIYLQFKEDFMGEEFFNKSGMLEISKMFQRARYGLRFSGETSKKAEKIILSLINQTGFQKVLDFLNLMHVLAESYEYKQLSNTGYSGLNESPESDKLNKVYLYITTKFKEDISLDEACKITNMSKSAFCQFFKKSTLKNFSDAVNEVRIGHAMKLMLEKDMSIAEACYESGFNNISYFNRKFREIYNMSPSEYLKQFKNNPPKSPPYE